MTVNISVSLVPAKDNLTQKCLIPIELLQNINARVGEYVIVQTSENKYLCHVQITMFPLNRIFLDNVITFTGDYERRSNYLETVNIPDDLKKIEPLCFNHIGVKVVFKDNEPLMQFQNKTAYEDAVQKILSGYVFGNNCVMKCSGMKLADLFHISHIIVLQTSPEAYGKLNKSSKVSIIEATWEQQMHQLNEFRRLQLGGTRDAFNILKLNIEFSKKILVLGPSGCGKSSLLKKFCSDMKCFFIMIDGLRTKNLTEEQCNSIEKKFSTYLKIFPSNRCMLVIDHIDAITPSDSKNSRLAHKLSNLIHNLKNAHVVIISAAVQKSDINPQISNLFTRQINLGMPSPEERKEIMLCLTKAFTCDFDYDKLWQMTPGFVAHDLSLLVQEVLNSKEKSENSQETDEKCLTLQDFEKALVNISPSILKSSIYYMKVKPVYWKDIDGMVDIKKRLQMCVELPLHSPEVFKKIDLPCPRGVLLFGPPGCCKTTLARGLATECNANFFAANPAQIYSCYVGESEKKITELFYQARISAPSIIFFDELDSLVSQRKFDQQTQGVGEKVLSALLNEMDGFGSKVQLQNTLNAQKLLNCLDGRGDIKDHSSDDVIVVAATNRPDLIDDALLRPGRFDKIVYVPPPNEEERELLLQTCMKDITLENVDLNNIAAQTHLFSGADLKQLCNEAKMNACRKDESASSVTEENFNDALRKVQPTITKQQIQVYEELKTKYGTIK